MPVLTLRRCRLQTALTATVVCFAGGGEKVTCLRVHPLLLIHLCAGAVRSELADLLECENLTTCSCDWSDVKVSLADRSDLTLSTW